MADKSIEVFSAGTVEAVARVIGDLYSGSELTRILASVKLADPLGEGTTKWRRVAAAMDAQQAKQRDGRPILALVTAAMAPDRALGKQAGAAIARDELTQILSLSGLYVRPDGRIGRTVRTTTASEAAARSERLHKLLTDRGAHPEVVRHCRPELLRKDCYEAVFEAVKGLGARLRDKSELDQDGRALVQVALRGKSPRLLLTNYTTVTERNEQEGVALLAEGVFAAFRNPAAHEPRLAWNVTEQDALDVLGTLSMIHRRLDGARLGTAG
ncbi:TIGR02391 family protein (plasmid) [Rhodococcus sp. DMF-1]|uniref:TIGR02391 family protein n=1 Tax=Rhodococcus sp. DMF-1 TaxID=2907624 RepID=UPI001F403058|nr:TIGR02391 family protein [Rhodococcus sp. DMF-1]UIR39713.1 TIGR02391 family protein [Rhodococcus sp. DMF-1]